MLDYRFNWKTLKVQTVKLAILACVLVLGACRKEPTPTQTTKAPAKVVWNSLITVHSAGGVQTLADTNATTLRSVLMLPETQAIYSNTLSRLNSLLLSLANPANTNLSTSNLVGSASSEGILAPLIDDVFTKESWVALRTRSDSKIPYVQAVSLLDSSRVEIWKKGLNDLASWCSTTIQKTNSGSTEVLELVVRTKTLRFATLSNWVFWTFGPEGDSGISELLETTQKSGRPVPTAPDYWVRFEGDFGALDKIVNTPLGVPLSRARLAFSGIRGRITTSAQIELAKDPELKLESWMIPTNAIHDPLVSFTALQGFGHWAKSWTTATNLTIPTFANQFYTWARGDIAFLTEMATPLAQADEAFSGFTNSTLPWINERLQGKGVGGLMSVTNRPEVAWRGLPVIIPHFRPYQDPNGTSYWLGGLFPLTRASTNPAPYELLGQVIGRTNLVYYDWEITEERLKQWSQIFQFVSIVSAYPKFNLESLGARWLTAIAPSLGNTITEITQESATSFKLIRRSDLGFTGLELTFLGQWFEESDFPRSKFRFPFEPVGFLALPPKANPRTPHEPNAVPGLPSAGPTPTTPPSPPPVP